jgi:hypothetical protein
MVAIKDFGMPKCCMNCEMFDGEYGNCDIMGDTQDFEYQWNENRPFDCPLVEAIPKDQYESRLKADLKAILVELQLEIKEKFENEFRINLVEPDDINEIIQQKINELKGEGKQTL